jgi:hypothetical protein
LTKTATKKSLRELEPEVLEIVQNELILKLEGSGPAATGGAIARVLWEKDADHVFSELGRVLVYHYIERLVMAERRKARPKPETLPLFGIADLPRRIITPEGKRPLLAKSTATEIRAYVKTLNAKHRERIAGLQTVLEHMEKYTGSNRRLTPEAVEALELEAS